MYARAREYSLEKSQSVGTQSHMFDHQCHRKRTEITEGWTLLRLRRLCSVALRFRSLSTRDSGVHRHASPVGITHQVRSNIEQD